jgi:hypothetical protein
MTATECSLPVFITSKLEADEDLLGLAIDIGVPLAQLGGHTVVDALEDAAVLVPVAFPVPAVLVAVAVCLDARDLAFDSRHGDVEVVVGAGTGVAALKAGDVPCPVSGDGDLAFLYDGLCERTGGGGGEGEEHGG